MATRSVSSLSETTSKRSITRDGLPKATATGSDSLPNAAAGRFGDGPRYTHDEPSSRLLGDRIDLPHDEPAGTAQNGAANGLRPHDSPTKASTEVSENLSGWAGIERHLFKHVTEEMKYYADDIDTLLVFAGLFSAFLTAFVVQTYPMLTADNSAMTNQLLALSVSSQLRTAGTIVSPTINATLAFLLDTTHFTPSAAVRAINVMFFLSLILSMASAFFGILSKQWIREHLKWNSALAEPRENVLVRQDRIEAWEAWNVAAFISSIPALLELAMMLFLAGVVTLLWTLDDVVAIIITAFAAIFIAVAAAFTILPVTLRRCPYKSPTAWACIAAYQASKPLLFRFARAVVEWAQWNLPKFTPLGYTHLAGIRSWVNRSYSIVRSWRDRDLQSCREARCRVAGKSVPRDEVHHAACRELKLLTGFSSLQLDELAENTLDDIAESALLTRALTWVKQSSQDPRIRAYTAEAAASVHRMMWDESLQHESKDRWAAKIVTNRCLLLALGTSIVRYPHSALVCLPVAAQESRRPSTVYDRSALVQHAALEIDRLAKSLPQDHAVSTPAVVTEVVCQVLVADIEHWSSRDDAQYLGKVELCTMILHLVERTWMLGDWYKDALRVMMSVDFGREEFDDIYMTVLLNTLAQDRLILDQNGKLAYSGYDTGAEDMSRLLQYFPSDSAPYNDDLARMLLYAGAVRFEQPDSFGNEACARAILQRVISALEAIASKQERGPLFYDICYASMDIIGFIILSHLIELLQLCAAELRTLAHVVERCYQTRCPSDFLTSMRLRLHALCHVTHADVAVCEEPTCRWVAHSCDGEGETFFEACSILRDWGTAASSPRLSSPGPIDSINTLPRLSRTRTLSGYSYPGPSSPSGTVAPWSEEV